MLDRVVVIYAIIDDILKAIGHLDDCRRQMSDAEVLTTALVAALFFSTAAKLTRRTVIPT